MFELLFICLVLLKSATKVCAVCTGQEGECCDNCPEYDTEMLNVHIVPHSHNDVGGIKTVDQYYYGTNKVVQNAGVQYILSSVVEELWNDPKRMFVYVETAFFWKWWVEQSDDIRDRVQTLVRQGRLQFAGGAWSMNDEATTHYQSIIDQFTWGLSKLNETFGKCGRPSIAWHIAQYGHSREFASLLSAMGYDGMFLGRIDYQDKLERLRRKKMEMVWRGDDSLGKISDMFTSVLYNEYFPPTGFCFDNFCYHEPIIDDPESPIYNVDERVTTFLEFSLNQSEHYLTNNVLITMGSDFSYQDADIWYKNLDRLIAYSNIKSSQDGLNIKVAYSTPYCYFKAVKKADPYLPVKQDDFFPYSDSSNVYNTGFYSSRPTLKFFERDANRYLQMVKQLQVWADLTHLQYIVNELKSAMGIMQHHGAITGTEKQHVAHDYERLLTIALDDAMIIVQHAFNKYLQKNTTGPIPMLNFVRCRLNESSCGVSELSDKFIISVYNPLAWTVNEVIRIPVVTGDFTYEVYNTDGNLVETQLVDIPEKVKKIPTRKSMATYEIYFAVEMEPVSYKTFYVQKAYRKRQRRSTSLDKQETILNDEKDHSIVGSEQVNSVGNEQGHSILGNEQGYSTLSREQDHYMGNEQGHSILSSERDHSMGKEQSHSILDSEQLQSMLGYLERQSMIDKKGQIKVENKHQQTNTDDAMQNVIKNNDDRLKGQLLIKDEEGNTLHNQSQLKSDGQKHIIMHVNNANKVSQMTSDTDQQNQSVLVESQRKRRSLYNYKERSKLSGKNTQSENGNNLIINHATYPRKTIIGKHNGRSWEMENVYNFKNEFMKFRQDINGDIKQVTLKDGTKINLKVQFNYYSNPTHKQRALSDAYTYEPGIIERLMLINTTNNDALVNEIRLTSAEFLHLTFRLYKNQNFLEVEWVAGPIDISDEIGKEIIIQYSTDMRNKAEFYTDSNGRQVLKRKLNKRPTWDFVAVDPIAGNYYPVTNKIYIHDDKRRLTILTDRAQGGSSLKKGQIELMLHRRCTMNSLCPMLQKDRADWVEPLNEVVEGHGLVARGKHRILFSKEGNKTDTIIEKKQVIQFHMQPIVLIAEASQIKLETWLKLQYNHQSWVKSLPEGVHLLTVEPISQHTLLLRLENYLDKGDKANDIIDVDMMAIFETIKVVSFKETKLAGNLWSQDYKKHYWKQDNKFSVNFNDYYGSQGVKKAMNRIHVVSDGDFVIRLKAKEIRTFVVKYEYVQDI